MGQNVSEYDETWQDMQHCDIVWLEAKGQHEGKGRLKFEFVLFQGTHFSNQMREKIEKSPISSKRKQISHQINSMHACHSPNFIEDFWGR